MSPPPLIVVIGRMPGGASWRAHLAAHGLRADSLDFPETGRLARVLNLLECDYDAPAEGPLRAIATEAADRTTAYCCCADLVALEADLDNVRLCGIVNDLQPDHLVQIAAAVNETLARLPARFRVDGDGNGCLTAVAPLDFTAQAPELLICRPLRAAMPDGVDGARIRALLTELQMVLHDHPVNIEREHSGLVPANGVWLWGGGSVPPGTDLELPSLSTNDAVLSGFWVHTGCAERRYSETEWSPASVERFGVISIDAAERDSGLFGALRKSVGRRRVYVVPPGRDVYRLRRAGLLQRAKMRALRARAGGSRQ